MTQTAALKIYRGSSADERRKHRREQLLTAAVRVYGERGFRNASVKAVCEAAGLTERYFYESFANGEAMLVAAFKAVTYFIEEEVRLAGEAAPEPGLSRVRAMLEALFEGLRRDPNSARVFLVEIGGVSPEVDQVLNGALERLADRLELALGVKPAAGRGLLKAGVAGALVQIAISWIAGGYAQPMDCVVQAGLRLTRVLAEG